MSQRTSPYQQPVDDGRVRLQRYVLIFSYWIMYDKGIVSIIAIQATPRTTTSFTAEALEERILFRHCFAKKCFLCNESCDAQKSPVSSRVTQLRSNRSTASGMQVE